MALKEYWQQLLPCKKHARGSSGERVTVYENSSVIRQKSESQNGCFKKTNHAKFSEKRTFLTPWYEQEFSFIIIALTEVKKH